MSNIDVVILVIIGFCAIASSLRGAVVEIFSFLVWLAAIGITLLYAGNFATLLPIDEVQSPLARATISAVILFTGTLFIGGILRLLVARIFSKSKLMILNRLAGTGVGALRGALLVSLLVLAANLSPELKLEAWWQNSTLIPRFQKVAKIFHAQLPETIGRHFDIST